MRVKAVRFNKLRCSMNLKGWRAGWSWTWRFLFRNISKNHLLRRPSRRESSISKSPIGGKALFLQSSSGRSDYCRHRFPTHLIDPFSASLPAQSAYSQKYQDKMREVNVRCQQLDLCWCINPGKLHLFLNYRTVDLVRGENFLVSFFMTALRVGTVFDRPLF